MGGFVRKQKQLEEKTTTAMPIANSSDGKKRITSDGSGTDSHSQ